MVCSDTPIAYSEDLYTYSPAGITSWALPPNARPTDIACIKHARTMVNHPTTLSWIVRELTCKPPELAAASSRIYFLCTVYKLHLFQCSAVDEAGHNESYCSKARAYLMSDDGALLLSSITVEDLASSVMKTLQIWGRSRVPRV